ncbi:MAG TPA: methyltransferase domain-containing protein [Bryobacteraceae bacterium]|nr:methyltransferase domain-containing protein [Bryobacteraceae bacterium]
MRGEFTGERVVPGQVDRELWHEHYARYAFAARLSRGQRVLDLGCGTGYGAAELAIAAASVIAVDVATNVIVDASKAYARANLRFVPGSAARLPFRDASFDLIVAYEVIEHLPDWPELIRETRRVLAPGGQVLLSTPNKVIYSESRGSAGPNPFHVHEFEYEEFREVLEREFPHVVIFLQDHAGGILIQATDRRGPAEVRFDGDAPQPQEASFFVAVCAATPQVGVPSFLYLPSGANLLRERLAHIRRLEDEVAQKSAWLTALEKDHAETVRLFREQKDELEARNRWAQELNEELETTRQRVAQLQEEVATEQKAAQETVAALELENERKTQWALETERRLTAELAAQTAELAKAVELLGLAEETVEERTKWALRLDAERAEYERRLGMVQASRWVRLGRAFGLGPEVGKA